MSKCSNEDNYTPTCCDDNWINQYDMTCDMLRNSGDDDPFLVGIDNSLSGYRCHQFCRTDSTCTDASFSDCVNYVKPDDKRSNENRTIHNVDFDNQNSDHSCKTIINDIHWCDGRGELETKHPMRVDCTECKTIINNIG